MVAAIPSLHAGYTALVLWALWPSFGRVGRTVLVAYPLAMAFTLVLTGEHYLVDIFIGWGYAAARDRALGQNRAVVDDAVIIEAAINGVTPKSRNPHVPIAPDEIAADARACFDAGAAIVHNHVDVIMVPGDEAADRYLEGWAPVLAERPDALLYPTVNFGKTVEESYAHQRPLAERGGLRIGIADLASVNLGGRDGDGLPTGHYVYANTFDDGHHQLALCEELGLGPSLAIFEPGFLRTALAWHAAGRLPAGAMVKLYFGGEGGYLRRGDVRPATDRDGAGRLPRAARRQRAAVVRVGVRRGRGGVRHRPPRAGAGRPRAPGPGGLRRRPHADQRRAGHRGRGPLCRGRPTGRLLGRGRRAARAALEGVGDGQGVVVHGAEDRCRGRRPA